MIKVLFVIPSKNSITGASLAVINIILGLLDQKIEVYVVASKPPKEYKVFLERLTANGAKLVEISSNKSGLSYWKSLAKKAFQIIRENDIPIVHLHLPRLVFVLGKEIKKQNKKLVLTVEGDSIYEVQNLGFVTRYKTKLLWEKCKKYTDIMCPCSQWLTNQIISRDEIQKIKTVHNPIDFSRFQAAKSNLKESLKISEDEFVVLTATRLTPVKGVDILIKGYADFVKRIKSKSRLIILGDGELRKELEKLADELELSSQIYFLGFRNNVQDYIACSDVFVMTSNYEPFGMPAAEAGCMGIPTIVSKAGGLMEIVLHGKTGYQFSIGDYKELAHYLDRLYSEPEIRKNFSISAKEHVFTNFSPKVIGEKFVKIYQELI